MPPRFPMIERLMGLARRSPLDENRVVNDVTITAAGKERADRPHQAAAGSGRPADALALVLSLLCHPPVGRPSMDDEW